MRRLTEEDWERIYLNNENIDEEEVLDWIYEEEMCIGMQDD